MSEESEAVDINGLDDVFETSDDGQPEESEQVTAQAEPPKAEPKDKGEEIAATPAAEEGKTANGESAEVPKGHIPIAAYQDEKRKRQALEEELNALKNPVRKQEEEKVDIFADPDKFVQSVDEKLARMELKTRISLSRSFMADLKSDYTEKEARFMQLASENPALVQKMRESENPAKFAYDTASKQLEVDAITNDPAAYREKIRQEILAEIGKAPAAVPEKKPKVEVSPSLATVPAMKADAEKLDTLDEMFGDSSL